VFAEYHGPGTRRGAYMLADRRYKYIHHVGAPSRLFDLQEDPGELRDLSDDPGVREVLVDMERRLRRIVEPEAADARARRDQAARVAATGGADAVRRRGTFDNSPVPGEAPVYFTREAGQDEQQEEQTR